MSELVRRSAGCVLGILVITAVGCDAILGAELNPAFCRAHPDDPQCAQIPPPPPPDAEPDAPPDAAECLGNAECRQTDGTGVCDLNGTKMCVQCLEDTLCATATPDKPVCKNRTCAICTKHAECASNVCLPDGRCADETMVAYVAEGGSGSDCAKATPCGTLAAGILKMRPLVKVASGTLSDMDVTTIDGTVKIFADGGAKLDRTRDGVILEVRDSADVQIFDLQISGATGSTSGAAVSLPNGGAPKLTLTRVKIEGNQGVGLKVDAGTLIMSRCTVQLNSGGGIQMTAVDSTVDISDSFIVYNGTAIGQQSVIGGVALAPNTPGSRFERNTVAFNQSRSGRFRGGVSCDGAMVVARGNIVYHNMEFDGAGGIKNDATTQNDGDCQFGNSLLLAVDPGNLGFAAPISMPYNFHLTGASPSTVVDAAGACNGIDFDGDVRPVNAACDLGADEFHL